MTTNTMEYQQVGVVVMHSLSVRLMQGAYRCLCWYSDEVDSNAMWKLSYFETKQRWREFIYQRYCLVHQHISSCYFAKKLGQCLEVFHLNGACIFPDWIDIAKSCWNFVLIETSKYCFWVSAIILQKYQNRTLQAVALEIYPQKII